LGVDASRPYRAMARKLEDGRWFTVAVTHGGAILHFVKMFARNKRMGLLGRLPVLNRFAGHGSWYDIHAALPAAARSAQLGSGLITSS
jgi:hypothetical protein